MKVRVWQVGYLDINKPTESIIPTRAGIKKIRKMIKKLNKGKIQDIVIGPEIKITELEIEKENNND